MIWDPREVFDLHAQQHSIAEIGGKELSCHIAQQKDYKIFIL